MAITEKSAFTVLGALGAFIFAFGGLASWLLAGPLIGLLVAVFGILVGMSGNREQNLLKCTQCGHKRRF